MPYPFPRHHLKYIQNLYIQESYQPLYPACKNNPRLIDPHWLKPEYRAGFTQNYQKQVFFRDLPFLLVLSSMLLIASMNLWSSFKINYLLLLGFDEGTMIFFFFMTATPAIYGARLLAIFLLHIKNLVDTIYSRPNTGISDFFLHNTRKCFNFFSVSDSHLLALFAPHMPPKIKVIDRPLLNYHELSAINSGELIALHKHPHKMLLIIQSQNIESLPVDDQMRERTPKEIVTATMTEHRDVCDSYKKSYKIFPHINRHELMIGTGSLFILFFYASIIISVPKKEKTTVQELLAPQALQFLAWICLVFLALALPCIYDEIYELTRVTQRKINNCYSCFGFFRLNQEDSGQTSKPSVNFLTGG